MQLCLSDQLNTADEDLETVDLFVIPSTVTQNVGIGEDTAAGSSADAAPATNGTKPPVEELYRAISACADLHPDPEEDGEGGGGEPMPGAGGWITSENMHEFMDADGNLSLPNDIPVLGGEENEINNVDGEDESLGAGAGRTRTAAEVEDADDGAEEETKWARTG